LRINANHSNSIQLLFLAKLLLWLAPFLPSRMGVYRVNHLALKQLFEGQPASEPNPDR